MTKTQKSRNKNITWTLICNTLGKLFWVLSSLGTIFWLYQNNINLNLLLIGNQYSTVLSLNTVRDDPYSVPH